MTHSVQDCVVAWSKLVLFRSMHGQGLVKGGPAVGHDMDERLTSSKNPGVRLLRSIYPVNKVVLAIFFRNKFVESCLGRILGIRL